MQLGQHVVDILGLVSRRDDHDFGWPERPLLSDDRIDLVNRLDNVCTGSLHDFNCESGFAVQPCITFRILVSTAYLRNVLEVHDTFTHCFDRHVENVLDALEYARNLDRKATLAGLQRAGCDKPVIEADEPDDLRLVQAIAFHGKWVDNNFHEFFADADKIDLEYAAQPLNFLFQVLGDHCQCALGHVAGNIQDQHRVKSRHLDRGDRRLLGFARQLCLGPVHFLTNVLQRSIGVNAGVEFDLHIRSAFVGVRYHFLHALN